MRCDYAHDDGAYVLGALSPAERSAYERHLAACPACREAVAEIAVLPGLLGRLDSATALQLLGPDGTENEADGPPWPVMNRGDGGDDARVVSLVGRAAQSRRRDRRARRFRAATTALVAAGAALIAAFGISMLQGGPTNPPDNPAIVAQPSMSPMSPVDGPGPVEASIGLQTRAWGTEIIMDCSYEKRPSGDDRAWALHMFAVGPDNESEHVSSWVAAPGKEVHLGGATRFSGDQLVRIELRRTDGTVMMRYDVP
jgi:hypothetical protein